MNKQKKSSQTCDFDQQNSDHSSESILIEERAKKLLDIDHLHVERRNIFNNAEKNVPLIRRSVIGRALSNRQKIISSTPMVKHAGNINSTDYSLNLSPIDIDIDVDEEGKHPVQGEIKTTEQDIVIVDSSNEHDATKGTNESKTYNTRRQSKQFISNVSQLKTRDSAGKYSDLCNTRKEDISKQMQKSSGSVRNNKSGSKLISEIKNNDMDQNLSERCLLVKLAKHNLTTLDKTSCESLKRNRNISMTLQSETVTAEPLNENASCPVSKRQQSLFLTPIGETNDNHLENAENVLTPLKSTLKQNETIKKNAVLEKSSTKKKMTTLISPQIQENSGHMTPSISRRLLFQQETSVNRQNQITDQLEYESRNGKSTEERISKIPVLRNRSKSRENVEKVDPVNLRTMKTPIEETPYPEVPSKHHNTSRVENKIPPKPKPRRKICKKPKTSISQMEKNNDIEKSTAGTGNISKKELRSRLMEDIENSINFEYVSEGIKNSKKPISQLQKSENVKKITPSTKNLKNNMEIQTRVMENTQTPINFETVAEEQISQLRKSNIAEKSDNLENDTPGPSNTLKSNKEIEFRFIEKDIGYSINFESVSEGVKNFKTPISRLRKSNNAEKVTPSNNKSKRVMKNKRNPIDFETVAEEQICQTRKSNVAEKSNNLENDTPGTSNTSKNNEEIELRYMEEVIGNSVNFESGSEEVKNFKTSISRSRKSNYAEKSTTSTNNLRNKEVQTRSAELIKSKTPISQSRMSNNGEKCTPITKDYSETETMPAEDIRNFIPDGPDEVIKSQSKLLQKSNTAVKSNTSTSYLNNKEIQTSFVKNIGTPINFESGPEKVKKIIKTSISQSRKSKNATNTTQTTNDEIQTRLVEDIGNSIDFESDEVNKPKTPISRSRKGSNMKKSNQSTNDPKNNEEIQTKLMKDIGTFINFTSVDTCTSTNSSPELSKHEKSKRLDFLISRFREKNNKNKETPKTRHTQVQTSSKKLPGLGKKLRNSVSKKIPIQTVARQRRKSMINVYDMESSGSSDHSEILQTHVKEGMGLFSSPQNEPKYFTSSDEEYDMYNETYSDVPWRFETTSIRTSNRFSVKLNFIKSAEEILTEKQMGNVSSGSIAEIKKTRQVYARESHRMTGVECARTMQLSPHSVPPHQNQEDDEELSDNVCSDEPTLTDELINEDIAESPTNKNIEQGHSVGTPRSSEENNQPNDQQINRNSESRVGHKSIRESPDKSVKKSGNIKTYKMRRPCVEKTKSHEESTNVPHENRMVDTNFDDDDLPMEMAANDSLIPKNNRSPHLVNRKHSKNRESIGRKQPLESQDEYQLIAPGSTSEEEMIVEAVMPETDFEQITDEPLENSNMITVSELPDNAVRNERTDNVHIISVHNVEPMVTMDGPTEDHDSDQNLLPDGIVSVDRNNKESPSNIIKNDDNSASRSAENQLMITSNTCQEEPVFKVPKTKSRKHNQKRSTKISADASETHDANEETLSYQEKPDPPISRGKSKKKLQMGDSDVTPLVDISRENSISVSGIRRSSRTRRQTTPIYIMEGIKTVPLKALDADKEKKGPPKRKTMTKSTSKRSKPAKRIAASEENKSLEMRVALESDDDYLVRPAPSNDAAFSSNQTSVLNRNTMDEMSLQSAKVANSEGNNGEERKSVRKTRNSTRDVSEVSNDSRAPKVQKKRTSKQPKPSLNVVVEEQDHGHLNTHKQPFSPFDTSPSDHGVVNSGDSAQPMENNVSQRFESSNKISGLATEDNARRSSSSMNSINEKHLHSIKGSRVTKKSNKKKESTTGCPGTVLKAIRKMSTDSGKESFGSEYIDVTLNEESLRLKYIEHVPNFRFRRDKHLASDPLQTINGSTTGFLKLPPGVKKPSHSSKKHILCFFVVQGEGEIRVQNCTSKVKTLSRFTVPVGIEYSISNESEDEALILGYVRMGAANT